MKFIISRDGTITINSMFVRTIYLEEDNASYSDNHTVVRVKAELNRNLNETNPDCLDCVVNLATFDSGNVMEDYKVAQAYLVKLNADLNGGKE